LKFRGLSIRILTHAEKTPQGIGLCLLYTLMAILVLYMDKTLGWSDSRKGDYYGLFLAFLKKLKRFAV
jgi:hypothetical protein